MSLSGFPRFFIRITACSLALLFALLLSASALDWPEASGVTVKKSSVLTVDLSNAKLGYIMAKASPGKKKYKLRIKKDSETLTYDLNGSGDFEAFPLQLGSGSYTISLYKNVSGKKYSDAGSVTIKVTLNDENAPFLLPSSQYVSYTSSSEAVSISEQLCSGLTDDRAKFDAIAAYIKKNYTYDFIRAVSIKSGQLPDIDYCIENKMGICQDLAALAACMLRVQGIPAKMMVGYANSQYHAWNSVQLGDETITYDPTVEVGGITGNVTYSVERFY